MENTIKLFSDTGNVSEVVEQLRLLTKTFGTSLAFSTAEIKTIRPDLIDPDINSEDHYPLKLYTKMHGGISVWVAEVRTGYAGASVDAMYECLHIAGFRLSNYILDSIRNKFALKATIWKEEPFGSVARY